MLADEAGSFSRNFRPLPLPPVKVHGLVWKLSGVRGGGRRWKSRHGALPLSLPHLGLQLWVQGGRGSIVVAHFPAENVSGPDIL